MYSGMHINTHLYSSTIWKKCKCHLETKWRITEVSFLIFGQWTNSNSSSDTRVILRFSNGKYITVNIQIHSLISRSLKLRNPLAVRNISPPQPILSIALALVTHRRGMESFRNPFVFRDIIESVVITIIFFRSGSFTVRYKDTRVELQQHRYYSQTSDVYHFLIKHIPNENHEAV